LSGAERLSLETELRHFRNVNGSLLRGALDKWAELWGELQTQVTSGVMILPDAQKGFVPQCGWPEFLEKMWQLKFYLDSAKRFCEQRR
jgi:hypothetical protein